MTTPIAQGPLDRNVSRHGDGGATCFMCGNYTSNKNGTPDGGCLRCARPGDVFDSELAGDMTAKEAAEYEAHEKKVREVAIWLMEHDGCSYEDPDELIYDSGPLPEPWGLRWQGWEDAARELIALVTANADVTGLAPEQEGK